MSRRPCSTPASAATGPFDASRARLEGVEALAAFCNDHGVELVAMEATGGYEKLPFALLWAQGVACAIVNPRAVRRFAEAMGFLEKTDRIDAGMIAWFAETKRIVACSRRPARPRSACKPWSPGCASSPSCARPRPTSAAWSTEADVLADFDELLALIARQMRALENEIAELIAGDPLWQKLDATFRSIKGVADRTVARLMAEMPEIGTHLQQGRRQARWPRPARPRQRQAQAATRPVRGGRASVRSILFVVAELVRRYDPDFAAFHKRLTDAGKPKKVIRIALAHKLLVRLNAKARDVRTHSQVPLDKPDSRSPDRFGISSAVATTMQSWPRPWT